MEKYVNRYYHRGCVLWWCKMFSFTLPQKHIFRNICTRIVTNLIYSKHLLVCGNVDENFILLSRVILWWCWRVLQLISMNPFYINFYNMCIRVVLDTIKIKFYSLIQFCQSVENRLNLFSIFSPFIESKWMKIPFTPLIHDKKVQQC